MTRRHDMAYCEKTIAQVIENVRKYAPQTDPAMIEKAFDFARKMHSDQKRESGEPYLVHPVEVAAILAELEMDAKTIVAAILHDCIEDTSASAENITQLFGSDVTLLVDGVTKLTNIEFRSKAEQKAESLRKMFVYMAQDIRVVIIKLADRLHNMRTLRFRDESKRIATAKETLEVYAPLAHRLGIYTIKWELEDLSFRYMDPQGYYDLVDSIVMKREERERAIDQIIAVLKEKTEQMGIKADIEGRPKHLYSIYRKMKSHNLGFDQIYDLIAVRVIVDDKLSCYDVLGLVHTLWKPIQGRFKDYISVPKPNGYQSLHTTLLGEKGVPFEVQIRTWDMHRIAEYGVAAHWKYKEGISQGDQFDQKLTWIRQLLDVQTEDTSEFMDTLRTDLFSGEVLVFTPKGDVIDLPEGSTPLDFAYRVHSQVGNKCIGAKVNQRIVTLNTPLKTGDIVEVLTSSSSKGPSLDWLKIVKTTQAKAKIRAFLKTERREQNIPAGREMMDREAKRQGYELSKLIKNDYVSPTLKRFSLHSLDDMYAAVGFGGLSSVQAVSRLIEEYRKNNKTEQLPEKEPQLRGNSLASGTKKKSGSNGVTVKGEPNMLVRLSRCCNPVPGDDIVGYITRGRGVSVHRKDCSNLLDPSMEGVRLMEVAWDDGGRSAYNAELQIISYDRTGLLAELTNLLAGEGIPLVAISARPSKQRMMNIDITIETRDTKQLQDILKRIGRIQGVVEVYRAST